MVKVTRLPSGPNPKKLTAYSPSRTLLEHQLAFLAQNNKAGSLTEQMSDEQVETLWSALQAMAQRHAVHLSEFNGLSCPLKRHKKHDDLERVDPPHYAISKNMLARMLGYKSYASVKYYLTSDKYIINRRNALVPLQESFSKEDKTLVSMPNKKVIAKLQENERLRIRKEKIDSLFPSKVDSIQEANRILDKNQERLDEEERIKLQEKRAFSLRPFTPTVYVDNALVPTSIAPAPKVAPDAPTWEELRAQYLASQKPPDKEK